MTEWIITSSVLILVVIILRTVLKGKISLRLQYALWALVLARLLIPGSLFGSAISVMNAVPNTPIGSYQEEPAQEVEPPAVSVAPAIPSVPAVPSVPSQPDTPAVTVPPVITPEEPAEIPWGQILRAVWCVGMAVMALCLLISNLRFWLRLRRSREVLKYSPPTLYMTEGIETPCLFGLFAPGIYVTPEVAEDKAALSHVLAHEQTHYRHGDHIWSVLRCVCLVLHWYNPLVWLAAALSRRDAELACDEGAIRRLGEEQRSAYGRTLISLTCTGLGGLFQTATTMTGSKKSIKERIVLIARKPRMKLYTLVAVILIAAIAAGCTFTGEKTSPERFVEWISSLEEKDVSQARFDYVSAFGWDSIHLSEEQKQELLSILAQVTEADLLPNEELEKICGLDIPVSLQHALQFECLSDGTVRVSCGDEDLQKKYRFEQPQRLDCPKLYDFIVQCTDALTEIDTVEEYAELVMRAHMDEVKAQYAQYDYLGGTQDYWTGQRALNVTSTRADEFIDAEVFLYRLDYTIHISNSQTKRYDDHTRWLTILESGNRSVLLGSVDLLTLQNVYSTPEMIDKYGDMYTAAAVEIYTTYMEEQALPADTLLETYAQEMMKAHAAELSAQLGRDVSVGGVQEITALNTTVLNTGAAGQNFAIKVNQVKYYLIHDLPEREDGSPVYGHIVAYTQYMFLLYQGDSVALLGHADETTLSNVYSTPEMIDKYGDMYTAAAMEMYYRYQVDRAYSVTLLAHPDAVETARFDLNGDGWEELIIKVGTCEADFEYVFYAYRNGVQGVEPIGRVDGGHSYLARDDGDLIVAGGYMGQEWAYRVTWDGGAFVSRLLFEQNVGSGAYTNWPERLPTAIINQGVVEDPQPSEPIGESGVGLTVEAESAKAAAEGFFMAYAKAELLSNGAVADYNVQYNEVLEISTDGNAVVGRFVYRVLPYEHAENHPDSSWTAGEGENEGWYYTYPYFLLEKQADGLWLCTQWSADGSGLLLEDYGYENGLWGEIYGNPQIYRCEETDPQKAAEKLIAAYVADLTKPDELRSFTVTEYRDLTVNITPTLEMSEADRSSHNYGLKEAEIGENHWIVEFTMEYRWTGILHGPPAGPGDSMPEDMWFNQTWQGSPVGFLLTRNGDEFTLQSRCVTRWGRS